VANPIFFPIAADYLAYRDRVTAGDAGTDTDLDGILAAMAAMETATLNFMQPPARSYGWAPQQITTPCPVIVGVPTAGNLTTTSPFDRGGGGGLGGFPGGMDEHTLLVDRFIVGGPGTGSILDAMHRAAAVWLPLVFAYAKNGTLGGAVHGCKITGATWQALPVGDATWIGLAVHTQSLCYYQLKAS